MKTNLNILIIMFSTVLWSNGCKTHDTITSPPPSSSEVYSLKYTSEGLVGNIKLIVQNDSVWCHGFYDPYKIDTVVSDSQQLDSLLQTFDVGNFWSLQDRVDENAVMLDSPLNTITITATSNNNTIAGQSSDSIIKVLRFTDPPYEQLSALQYKIEHLILNRFKH